MSTHVTTSPVRRAVLVLVAVLTLLAGVLAAAAPASAHPGHRPGHRHGHGHGHHHPVRHTYLALGDSVPFGYRPAAVTPPTDYLDASNFVGYPEVVARRLHLRVANATCPGETTASFLTAGALSNGCENSPTSPFGYRTAYPLHVAYTGTQLSYARHYLRTHPRTRLVTLTIGANDLFICQSTTADHCTGSDLTDTVATVEQNADKILSAVRATGYRHRIVVVDYYSVDYADPVQTGGSQLLDAALTRAAARHRAVVADGFGAFQRAAAASGGDSCAAGLVIALPTGGCDVHPTEAGRALLARAVLAAVHRS